MRVLYIAAAVSIGLTGFTASSATAQTTSTGSAFAGPRIEAAIGYDELDNNSIYVDIPQKLSGTAFRGTIGYDFEVAPHLIVGVELSAGTTTGSGEERALADDLLRLKLGSDIDGMARIGYRMGPRTLAYAKVGVARSALKSRYLAKVGPDYDITSIDHDAEGLRYGGGVEHLLSTRGFVKLEYRRTNYGSVGSYYLAPDRTQLLLGVGLRFKAVH